MQQDYIMRLIERIAALLASIIAKERAGLYPEAKADIEEKAQQTIGMGLRDLRRLSPEAVSELLGSSGSLRYGRAVILAELLLHDAAVSDAIGEGSDALLDYLHAFCLLSDTVATLSDEEQAVYRPKLESVVAHLRSLPAHPYVREKLLEYDSRPGT
jgi:hypothetical protein